MDQKKFDELTDLLAQDLKTEKDVSAMTRMLSKFAMEKALEIEMEEHLGEKEKAVEIQVIPEMDILKKL